MTVEPDEVYAGVMLQPLAVEPLPSPCIDIDRAIADGRRGNRRRRALAGVAVVSVGVLTVTVAVGIIRSHGAATNPSATVDVAASGATPAPPSCRIEQLAVPGDQPVRVTGMDPTGRYVLGQALPTNNTGANQGTLIWDNGQPTAVHLPGTQQEISDITTSGVTIGDAVAGHQGCGYVAGFTAVGARVARSVIVPRTRLAACNSTGTPARPAPTSAAAAAAAVSAPMANSSSPTASLTPTVAAVPKLGTAQPFSANGSSARLTGFAVRQPTALKAPKPQAAGMEWASADVQVCADALGPNYDYLYVTNDPWSLVYADGTTGTPPSVTYQQFDAPEYPITERTIKVGRCIRGWVTFTAPAGKKATMVEYQSRDGDVFDWAL